MFHYRHLEDPQASAELAALWPMKRFPVLVEDGRIVAVGERGLVILSDDRGASWRQVPSPVSVTLTMVRFADEQHGVAVGHGGTVLTTDDAGTTWRLPSDTELAFAAGSLFPDETLGVAADSENPALRWLAGRAR